MFVGRQLHTTVGMGSIIEMFPVLNRLIVMINFAVSCNFQLKETYIICMFSDAVDSSSNVAFRWASCYIRVGCKFSIFYN